MTRYKSNQPACFELPDYDITLYQDGPDDFTVRYGLQVNAGLDYSMAARRLGEAILHAFACDYHIDNRDREEAAQDAAGPHEDDAS